MPALAKKLKITKDTTLEEVLDFRKDHVSKSADNQVVVSKAATGGSYDKETRTARFIMTTQQVDRYGDVVVTNGVDTKEFEKNPVAPFCHDTRTWPIGKWSNLEKVLKSRPARMEGDMTLMPEGGPIKLIEEAAWMLEMGGIKACSIGFIPSFKEGDYEILRDDEDYFAGIKFLVSELIECSPCIVPANAGALMKMKHGDINLAREFVENILDNWSKTPEGLIVPRAEFEAMYRSVTEPAKKEAVETVVGEAPAVTEKTTDEPKPKVNILNKTAAGVAVKHNDDGSLDITIADPATDSDPSAVVSADAEKNVIVAGSITPGQLKITSAEEVAEMQKGFLASLSEKIADMFGKKTEPAVPPEPASEEAINAAKARSAEQRQRLAAKLAA